MTTPLTVLSWNLWFGGSTVTDAPRKQLDVLEAHLRHAPQPILLVQESLFAAERIASALGWNVVSAVDTAICSPLPLTPIATRTGSYACAGLVDTADGQVLAWSAHLDHRDYGPYFVTPQHARQVNSLMGEQLRAEQSARIIASTEAVARTSGAPLPVVIGGDFNVPATRDWAGMPEHADAVRNGLRWEGTETVIEAGFDDTFRTMWPDPAQVPGTTWSPIEPVGVEPRDRIDFVFSRGFEVISAHHLGGLTPGEEPGPDLLAVEGVSELIPQHSENTWPSDHLGVLASLTPAASTRTTKLSADQSARISG